MQVKIYGRGYEKHSNGLNRFKKCLEGYTSDKITIATVDLQHGHPYTPKEPIDKNSICIVLFSIPIEEQEQFYQGLLETVDLGEGELSIMDCQSDAYIYNSNVPMIDYDMVLDKRGQVMGLMRDNILWVTFDLVHEDNYILEITNYLIKEAYGLIGKQISPEAKREIELQHLSNLYKHVIKREVEESKRLYETQQEIVSKLAKDFSIALKKLHEMSMVQELYKDRISNIPNEVTRLMEAIRNNVKINRVKVVGESLCIDTNDIFLGPFNIGRYRIMISSQGLPKISKIDKVIKGKLHPHCLESGELCYGGFKQGVSAYNLGKWDEVIVTVISVLESYDSESCYTSLEKFLEKHYPEQYSKVYPKYVPKNKKIWKIIGGEVKLKEI